ncbi:MAG: transporter substrate-binding domain-containing protein [Oceanospirillaceae bacterium]|nr:transporter substrate-binding domain-containing protein [Oceanospirillaceae bacterium]
MQTVVKFSLLIVLFLAAPILYAVPDKTIQAAIPSSMPPYVIEATQSGIILDIINNIYNKNGYRVDFSFLPNHRVAKEFIDKKHALAFGIPNNSSNQDIFYSDAILSFKNVAITLTTNNFEISSPSDMKNMSITAFQNATNFLGEQFKEMALDNLHYEEITNQQHQLTLLLKGRTDVIVLEERIFLYHLKQLKLSAAIKQQFRTHPIFNAAKRYCVFHSAKQRDMFNKGLNTIKQSSEYKDILNKHITVLKS